MAIEIAREFEVEQPPEEVWAFLTTPERVVECLPGAEMVEQVDDRTYRGKIGTKLGPIDATFEGTITFDRLDRDALEVEMSGSGEDRGGKGTVKMQMHSKLEPLEDGGTAVSVSQTIELSGKLATFGRGGIVKNVADFMFGRFTSCVEEKLAAG